MHWVGWSINWSCGEKWAPFFEIIWLTIFCIHSLALPRFLPWFSPAHVSSPLECRLQHDSKMNPPAQCPNWMTISGCFLRWRCTKDSCLDASWRFHFSRCKLVQSMLECWNIWIWEVVWEAWHIMAYCTGSKKDVFFFYHNLNFGVYWPVLQPRPVVKGLLADLLESYDFPRDKLLSWNKLLGVPSKFRIWSVLACRHMRAVWWANPLRSPGKKI